MDPRKHSSDFRLDIQGLRGIAVLLVVLYHAGFTFLSGGYIGVDVFFVISGYVISGLLLREIEDAANSTGTHLDFWRFYGRRMRRLLPAALVVVISTSVCAWFIYAPLELKMALPV
ncbi:MAG: acyltransferase [Gammaproteobacteria bacterium]|nr:acyltransferase [Gammaproteobacteria bacterium]